jgi:hypothetical protein
LQLITKESGLSVRVDDLAFELFHSSHELGLAFARRRLLAQAGPTHGVEPGLPDAAVAVVHRAGRREFASKNVLRIETPEAGEVANPGDAAVDQYGRPLLVLSRAEGESIAARVIDEGHRNQAGNASREALWVSLV